MISKLMRNVAIQRNDTPLALNILNDENSWHKLAGHSKWIKSSPILGVIRTVARMKLFMLVCASLFLSSTAGKLVSKKMYQWLSIHLNLVLR